MLMTMKEILKDAKDRKYAVGAFNVPNLESIQAVIAAAEELKVPVILQHAEVHENLISMQEIGPIMLDYARRASVPVCVHLDHGASFDLCIQAIRLGFTSIMYDASAKSYEENLEETKEIVKIALKCVGRMIRFIPLQQKLSEVKKTSNRWDLKTN